MSDDPGTAPKIGDKLGICAKIKTAKDSVNPTKTPSVADRLRRSAPVDYKKLHNQGKSKTPSDKDAKEGYYDSSSSDDGFVDRKIQLGSPHSLGIISSVKTPKSTGSDMEDTDDELVRLQNEH